MTVDRTALAEWSNVLVDSAILIYAIALLAFGVDLSGRGRRADQGSSAVAGADAEAEVTGAAVAPVAGGSAVATVEHAAGSGTTTTATTTTVITTTAHVVTATVPARSRAAGIAVSLTWLAFLVHLAGVLARGLSIGRVPWANMYEFSVAGALVVTGVFLAILLRRDLRYLGSFVVGPVLLVLGLAVTAFYTEAAQLVPALDSYWLLIHVSVAFVAAALFTIGFSVSVLHLLQHRRELARLLGRAPARGRFLDTLPPSAELELLAYRLHVVAFPLWTFTVVVGAVWADAAWGRYWGWDPKEVWSFVVWVVYAAYLHARATRGWAGTRSAYLVFAGFCCLVFNFVGVNLLFSGLHSYSGVG